jgi:hypothetical protein
MFTATRLFVQAIVKLCCLVGGGILFAVITGLYFHLIEIVDIAEWLGVIMTHIDLGVAWFGAGCGTVGTIIAGFRTYPKIVSAINWARTIVAFIEKSRAEGVTLGKPGSD